MKFGISAEVASATQSTRKIPFEGDAIYDVTFDGCEVRSYEKDGFSHDVLDIKFSDDIHEFTHTIFEPQDGDDERTQSERGYDNPSRLDNLNLLIMHLFDATNPTYAKDIREGSKTFEANSWDELKDSIVKITTPGIGKKMKIKLFKVTTTRGTDARWPSYIGSFRKDGALYLNTTFVGNNVYFTTKESNKIKNAAAATPTPVNGLNISAPSSASASNTDGVVGGTSVRKINFNM